MKKFSWLIFLAVIFPIHPVLAGEHENPVLSEKWTQVLNTQQEIIKQLDAILKNIEIVKLRVTSRRGRKGTGP